MIIPIIGRAESLAQRGIVDLIGDSESGEVDEASLYFGWKRNEKKYRMVDRNRL